MNTGNNINTTRSPRRKELTMNRVSRVASLGRCKRSRT